VKLHALVENVETARAAIEGGATVIQLRLKGLPTPEVVERGGPLRDLCADRAVTFVVNDDVDAAVQLDADGVHLGRGDAGIERALEAGLLLGLSAASVEEAEEAEQRGATYVGAGPVWATSSKPDADPPIGLDGLREICDVLSVPVVAIGGVDPANARACIEAGADARSLTREIDAALATR
jgi:thiamine-phosphate pyrophosphorylase